MSRKRVVIRQNDAYFANKFNSVIESFIYSSHYRGFRCCVRVFSFYVSDAFIRFINNVERLRDRLLRLTFNRFV